MKLKRIGIAVTVLALGVALAPGSAWADHMIQVSYETVDKGSTICVTDKPTIGQKDKNLKIKKLDQKIQWQIKKTKGPDAGGTWEIRKLLGGANPSVDLCKEQIVFGANGMAECVIAAELQYSYDLTWKKAGCADVKADPVIIFESGKGGPFMPFLALPFLTFLAAAVAAFALGMFLGRKRRS